jgi:hypothetical protein
MQNRKLARRLMQEKVTGVIPQALRHHRLDQADLFGLCAIQLDQLRNPGESKTDLRAEKERRRKANKQKKAKRKYGKGPTADSSMAGEMHDE